MSVILLVSGIIKKNSRIIAFLLFALLWILFGLNAGNIDYKNYERGFSWAHGHLRFNTEIGIQIIYKLFIFAGLTYKHFLAVFSLVGLLLILKTIERYTQNVAFVLTLYFIFPFLIDVVQIRNFMIMAIVLYGTRYLIEDKIKGTFKFVVLVILASTIHYSASFYLLLLLVKQKGIKSLLILSVVITFISIISIYSNFIPSLALKFVPAQKVNHWFRNRFNWGIIPAAVIYLVNFFFIYYSYLKIKSGTSSDKVIDLRGHETNLRYAEVVFKINIILMLVFPFFVFNMIFFRLFRNMFVLDYIMYSICLSYLIPKTKEKALFTASIILFILMLSFYYTIYSYFNTVFIPVFQDNLLLGKY